MEEELWMTFHMQWAFKGEGPDPLEGGLMIQNAVLKTIGVIEAAAAATV